MRIRIVEEATRIIEATCPESPPHSTSKHHRSLGELLELEGRVLHSIPYDTALTVGMPRSIGHRDVGVRGVVIIIRSGDGDPAHAEIDLSEAIWHLVLVDRKDEKALSALG